MSGEYSEEELEEIHGRIGKWFERFADSEYIEILTEEEKGESGYIIGTFTEYMYSYLGVPPEEWGRAELRECCLDILPRKVSAEESYFRSIAPVLSAFFEFTSREGLLDNTAGLIDDINSIADRILENGMDPSCWGMAKLTTCSAKDAGVDTTNPAEFYQYLLGYNARLMALSDEADSEVKQNYRKEKPKVGRNEPCPCGSGKKYKKCCGKT